MNKRTAALVLAAFGGGIWAYAFYRFFFWPENIPVALVSTFIGVLLFIIAYLGYQQAIQEEQEEIVYPYKDEDYYAENGINEENIVTTWVAAEITREVIENIFDSPDD